MLSAVELRIIDTHTQTAGVATKARVAQTALPQPDRHSVLDPRTGRLHVHKADRRKSADQQFVFESAGGVANTLTAHHPLKLWDLRRRATPRETARLQGFPEAFQLPGACYNQLFGKAVSVPVAEYAIRSLCGDAAAHGVTFVDVCAGIGGFHLAATSACQAACVGYSEVCRNAQKCYELNFPGTPALGSLFDAEWPRCDLVCMGFPCQPFSRSMQSIDRRTHGDRNVCEALPAILDATQATLVVLENVQSILTLGKEQMRFIASTLEARGFRFAYRVLNSADFGLPQTRKRLYIIAATTHQPEWADHIRQSRVLQDIMEVGK